MSDFLAHLNPAQRQAAQHYCGAMLVVAGAGSGKTRTLTYRIANLVHTHGVEPHHILAVTFTNKAAKEMKERLELLFAEQLALGKYQQSLRALEPALQTRTRATAYKKYIQPLWMGTFHSLFAQILRLEIEHYRDEKGRNWKTSFSIFDENDVQSLIKSIVTQKLNLDDKKFEPRAMRFAISGAKNQGLSPSEFAREQPNYRGRTIAQIYELYQDHLAANNALDFDDLILIPVRLFQQQPTILERWHHEFQHILVDEYQDTNRTQYDLIRLLATNSETQKKKLNWQERSIFVVGDADQSIYRFRGADYTILLEFQQTFGDGLADDDSRTMVKLEENYRSTSTILEAANQLIQHNTERIEKVLRPTRSGGELIHCSRLDNEEIEADYVINRLRTMNRDWGDFALLYRTNAQSRPLEETLVRWGIPYTVVGGLRFYDRKEVRDLVAYLRVLVNPADSVSVMRIINVPKRGIGKTTLDRLQDAAQTLGIPLWDLLQDESSVISLAGRSSRGVLDFVHLIQRWQSQVDQESTAVVVAGIAQESGYISELQSQDTDEAKDRLQNVQELVNAARQFDENNPEHPHVRPFLANVALASDLDQEQLGQSRVTLMTLHASKGLEFPVVFMVGMEQGLFPSYRSLDDPAALEEERRLCYVGITRAQDQLIITHVRERRLYGTREPALPSCFLGEIPPALMEGDRRESQSLRSSRPAAPPPSVKQPPTPSLPRHLSRSPQVWAVGERLHHAQYGDGQITHVFGTGNRMTIAVKFAGLGQQKVIDPRLAPIEKMSD